MSAPYIPKQEPAFAALNQAAFWRAACRWLMNLTDSGFAAYWLNSLVAQVRAGGYDGIFFDSASPPLIQGETVDEPRLRGTGVKDAIIPELGGVTYITAWETWISALNSALEDRGIPLIPNYDNFGTSWDTTNYRHTNKFQN